MSDHETWREAAGAYVVGALDATERGAFEDHMRGCERCRDEVLSLSPLPGLLARVDPDEVDEPVGPPVDAVVAAVRDQVAGIERSRRRWRWVASAAAACAVIVGAVAIATSGGDGASPDDDRGVVLELAASSGVSGEIVADERAWGTYVHVALDDLPPADGYELWIVARDGDWYPAGTWSPTPDGSARLGGSCELALAEIDRIVVTSADRAEEIAVAS